MTIAKVAVQSVGISDRDSGNNTVVVDFSLTAVTNSIASRNLMQLKDSSLQCRYVVDNLIVARVDSIKS